MKKRKLTNSKTGFSVLVYMDGLDVVVESVEYPGDISGVREKVKTIHRNGRDYFNFDNLESCNLEYQIGEAVGKVHSRVEENRRKWLGNLKEEILITIENLDVSQGFWEDHGWIESTDK